MSETFVKFEIQGHLAIFTLNRPKAMNAVNQKLSEQFENALDTFENDDSLWVRISLFQFFIFFHEESLNVSYVKHLSFMTFFSLLSFFDVKISLL